MRSMLTLAFVALAMTAACVTPNLDDPEPLSLDDSPSARGSGKSASTTPPAGSGQAASPAPSSASTGTGGGVDAGPQAKRWRGAVGATLPVEFGGGGYCRYRITLEQVKVDVVAAASGEVVAATVTATALEEVVSPSCQTATIPSHTQTYALVRATVLPSGVGHLELVGLSTNDPPASLVVEGDFHTASPALSLAWHRTNQGPPLDWRVSAQVTATLE